MALTSCSRAQASGHGALRSWAHRHRSIREEEAMLDLEAVENFKAFVCLSLRLLYDFLGPGANLLRRLVQRVAGSEPDLVHIVQDHVLKQDELRGGDVNARWHAIIVRQEGLHRDNGVGLISSRHEPLEDEAQDLGPETRSDLVQRLLSTGYDQDHVLKGRHHRTEVEQDVAVKVALLTAPKAHLSSTVLLGVAQHRQDDATDEEAEERLTHLQLHLGACFIFLSANQLKLLDGLAAEGKEGPEAGRQVQP
mmetsp:Transcript_54807/g.128692  ORF Transcript_54807/g.128692 Transcript_54807/m.128692 type:complete len:251 (-) Transcript_54807:7-759(-)